ncbi:MAG: outer membrane beta-barrel protein [Candidatus Aminicenantes bacterium]|nr:MAG: outer membrane beta-barrel protein [Candidatus Aminicenantes bacterium]
MKRIRQISFYSVFLFLTLCLIYFIAPPKVSGQAYRTFNQQRDLIENLTRWQIGPFRIYPVINFQRIGYDNNIYRQQDDSGPIADATATISPVLNTYVLFRNWIILDFSINPEYVYYVKTERERSLNFAYSPTIRFNMFNRFVLSGTYQYDKARRRASSEFDVRANQILNSFTGQFFYESARETSIGITGWIRKFEFEDDLEQEEEIYYSRQLNRTEKSISGEFYYMLRPEIFMFITGGYTDYTFEYEESRWRDSYSYQVSSGVRFPILGDVRGTISLGFKKLTPKLGTKKYFAGPIGNINVEARMNRLNLRGRYIKDARISYWTNNAFYVEYMYGAGLSYYLTQFFRLDYDFFNGDNRYPETTLIRLPDESYLEILRRDKYRTHRVGTVIRIISNTGLGLTVDFWERTSNDPRIARRSALFLGGFITYDF